MWHAQPAGSSDRFLLRLLQGIRSMLGKSSKVNQGGSSASVLLINTRPGPSRLAPVTGVGFWSTGKMGSRLANRDLLQVQIAAPRHCKGCSSARCPFARISIRPWVGPCPGAPLRASVCVSFSLSLSRSLPLSLEATSRNADTPRLSKRVRRLRASTRLPGLYGGPA